MSLTTKTKYVCGVVRLADKPLGKEDALRLKAFFESIGVESYWVIVHNRDVNDGGELITPHLHFVSILGHAPRLSTIVNQVASALDVDTIAVSCQKASSVPAAVQYLIHKNNPEKVQYAECEIYTNCDTALLHTYLDAQATGNTYENIKIAIATCSTLSEVVEKLGFQCYNGYRGTIKDLWQDKVTHGHV